MSDSFSFPILLDKDQDWVFIASCPIFKWFATQWQNLELLKNNLQKWLVMKKYITHK